MRIDEVKVGDIVRRSEFWRPYPFRVVDVVTRRINGRNERRVLIEPAHDIAANYPAIPEWDPTPRRGDGPADRTSVPARELEDWAAYWSVQGQRIEANYRARETAVQLGTALREAGLDAHSLASNGEYVAVRLPLGDAARLEAMVAAARLIP